MKTESQNAILLSMLKAGKRIDNYTALTQYSIGRLASRIGELREKGFNIITDMVLNADGEGRHAVYHLEGE